MKTIVHVNQHNIKHNRTGPCRLKPVFTVKDYKKNRKGYQVVIRNPETQERLGTFVYSPNKPLNCGATVWFETDNVVEVE